MKHIKECHMNGVNISQTICLLCGKENETNESLQEHLSVEHYGEFYDKLVYEQRRDDDDEKSDSLDGSPKHESDNMSHNMDRGCQESFMTPLMYKPESGQTFPHGRYNGEDGSLEKSLKDYEKFLGTFVASPDQEEFSFDDQMKRKFKCSFPGCGRSFKRSGHLKRHKIVHLPQKERKRFHCDESGCNKHYSTKYDLAAHKRQAHEGLKLYRCIFRGCCRRFVRKDSLEKHLASFDHSNQKLDIDCLEFDIHATLQGDNQTVSDE